MGPIQSLVGTASDAITDLGQSPLPIYIRCELDTVWGGSTMVIKCDICQGEVSSLCGYRGTSPHFLDESRLRIKLSRLLVVTSTHMMKFLDIPLISRAFSCHVFGYWPVL